jgi:hypothetical protein
MKSGADKAAAKRTLSCRAKARPNDVGCSSGPFSKSARRGAPPVSFLLNGQEPRRYTSRVNRAHPPLLCVRLPYGVRSKRTEEMLRAVRPNRTCGDSSQARKRVNLLVPQLVGPFPDDCRARGPRTMVCDLPRFGTGGPPCSISFSD